MDYVGSECRLSAPSVRSAGITIVNSELHDDQKLFRSYTVRLGGQAESLLGNAALATSRQIIAPFESPCLCLQAASTILSEQY